MKEIRVGIGEYAITTDETLLTIHGLGSCVGISLFEKELKISALIHILLPDSTRKKKILQFPGKYASSAIDMVVSQIEQKGGKKENITAKIAGGAHMFSFSSPHEKISIGDKNIKAVKEKLSELNIELLGEDVGGSHGRSMIVNPISGTVIIKTIQHGTIEL